MIIRTTVRLVRSTDAPAPLYGLTLTRGNRMLKIHVWKSKPSWLSRSPHEKQWLIDWLSKSVRANLNNGDRAEAGPYLIDQTKSALLIWTVKADSAKLPADFESAALTADFEPLTFVSPSDTLTAKKLAERLGGTGTD